MRRRIMSLAMLVLAAAMPGDGAAARASSGPAVATQCDRGPLNPASAASYHLDRFAADWGVFCDRDSPTSRLRNVASPALDAESLECAITGSQPYGALHCYRNLVSTPAATSFTLSTFFRFTPATTCNNAGSPSAVQALEFTTSKWYAGKRWEFAVQWENVASGAESTAPQWRWWNGTGWIALSPAFPGCLAADTWHYLRLAGSIVGGMVRYDQLVVDGQVRALGMTVPPVVTSDPDKLAVAFQLDANSQGSPFSLFVDQVHLLRS